MEQEKFSWNVFFIKITSRKFLLALVGVISMILTLFNVDEMTKEQIIAIAAEVVVIIGYITGESIVDAKSVSSTLVTVEDEVAQAVNKASE